MKKGFKFLGLFLLSVFGLISFSNAGNYVYEGDISFHGAGYRYAFGLPIPTDLSKNVSLTCEFSNVNNIVSSSEYNVVSIYLSTSHSITTYTNTSIMFSNSHSFTTNIKTDNGAFAVGFQCYSESCETNFHYVCTFSGTDILSCPECETCPEVDTGSILSGYVAVSDIDMSYCVSNDLCPEMSGGYSALYINDIRHESMPFINITIPEEFNWDYSYTGNNTQFDLNVIGYNTDPDYIAGIINTQSTKPNSTDFNNIVSGLIPLLIPGLVIILFVWFIFKFIKKIF